MPTRVALCWVLMAMVLFAGGCSTAKAPRLTVESAQLTERTAEGMVVTFTILADNANNEALPLRDVNYSVTLSGKQVFSGVRSAQATVSRFGTQTFTLPAAIPLSGGAAPTDAEAYAIRGTIRYLVPGALAETLFDIHVLRPSTDFSGSGIVDLSTVKTPTPTEITGPGARKPVRQPANLTGPSPH